MPVPGDLCTLTTCCCAWTHGRNDLIDLRVGEPCLCITVLPLRAARSDALILRQDGTLVWIDLGWLLPVSGSGETCP